MDGAPPEAAPSPRRRRVLFISADPVGEQMSGVGIRYFELGRVLSDHGEVTIAHTGAWAGMLDGIPLVPYHAHAPKGLLAPLARADLVVAQPQWPVVGRWLREAPARVIFDIYDPETFETLELMVHERPLKRRVFHDLSLDRLHDALLTGHHFICASEKQRDLWLGAMLGLRLIDPSLYDRDPSLRSVIDTVPFGLPADRPLPPADAGPRGRLPGIEADSELVLWNGGVWNWLDPVTAVRAAAALARSRPRLRLLFMGASPRAAATTATAAAHAAARELGVHGTVVHFHEAWVPYAERGAWLAEADCAISTHAAHLETRFSFRTRLLDCFWAGLPVVCSGGDDLSDRVAREDLGAVAAPEDVDELVAALELVLDRGRGTYALALESAARDYAWPRVAEPLVRWLGESVPPPRIGDATARVGRTPAHLVRSAAYRCGLRWVLHLRRPRM